MSFSFFHFAYFDRFALHTRGRALMCRACELDRRVRLRGLFRKEQIVEFSGLSVDDHAAFVPGGFLHATGAGNALTVSGVCTLGTSRRTHR
jgi:hypothetical protein